MPRKNSYTDACTLLDSKERNENLKLLLNSYSYSPPLLVFVYFLFVWRFHRCFLGGVCFFVVVVVLWVLYLWDLGGFFCFVFVFRNNDYVYVQKEGKYVLVRLLVQG